MQFKKLCLKIFLCYINLMEIIRGEVYSERGSKFFGYVAHVNSVAEFKEFMRLVEKEHGKKASHFCYAYVVDELVSGNQMSFFNDVVHKEKYSNANEPSGCGNALLTLLKSNNLQNLAIIVVRYFGGILLGSGNLIRAYATAGKNAVKLLKS